MQRKVVHELSAFKNGLTKEQLVHRHTLANKCLMLKDQNKNQIDYTLKKLFFRNSCYQNRNKVN